MTKDEALKLALEALENGKKVRAFEGGTKYQPCLEDQAIAAIKNVQAQPEQAPVGLSHREGYWCVDLTCKKCYSSDFRFKHTKTQRKPLTDEQFNLLVMEHLGPHALTGGKMSVYDAFLKGIRATEDAHGIKGDE